MVFVRARVEGKKPATTSAGVAFVRLPHVVSDGELPGRGLVDDRRLGDQTAGSVQLGQVALGQTSGTAPASA